MASAVPILCGPRSRGLGGLAQRCPIPREEVVKAGHRCVGDAGEGVLRQDLFSGCPFVFRGRRRCWPLRAGRVGTFPSHEALIRLVGVLVLEQNDELAVCRCYMPVEKLSGLCDEREQAARIAADWEMAPAVRRPVDTRSYTISRDTTLLRPGRHAIRRAPERWPSGRRRTPGKRVYRKRYRGFESLPLRHHSAIQPPRPQQNRLSCSRPHPQ